MVVPEEVAADGARTVRGGCVYGAGAGRCEALLVDGDVRHGLGLGGDFLVQADVLFDHGGADFELLALVDLAVLEL